MLAHGIVTIIRSRRRSVAFTAAAPVDADHPEGAWEKPGGEFDPVLAGEITVDEDHGNVAFPPFSPAELNLACAHPRHWSRSLTFGGRPWAMRRAASAQHSGQLRWKLH